MRNLIAQLHDSGPVRSFSRAVRRSRFVRQFLRRDETGVVAIEFAFIAPIFLAFIFFLFQSGYIFFAAATLDDGVHEASRLIKTGQVDSSGMTQIQFRDFVCSFVSVPETECKSKLVLDVDSYTNFASIDFTAPAVNGTLDNNASNYNPGGSSEIVLVKAFLPLNEFEWVHKLLNGSSSGAFVIASTAAFRNEPF